MKIAILTQYYPPEHGAPQNRLHDLASRWKKAGVDVTVLCAMPNYPVGRVFEDYRGKIFHKEEIDGIKVIRSWIFASKKKSTLLQLAVYFSFVFSSIFAGLFFLKKPDVIIFESPPLFLGISALILRFLKRSRMIMNVSDLWPESAVQLGILGPGPALSCLEYFEKTLYKKSLIVSCQTEGIVEGVRKSSPDTDTYLFPNGVDLEMFKRADKDSSLEKELGIPEGFFIVGYGGNHGRSQALEQVLKAAEILKDKKVFFAFFGDGPEKENIMQVADDMKLENVGFYPSQARHKMSAIQALWDAALVPLRNIELFDGARPSKMFELMAGETPFVFCGKGEGAHIALESGCAEAVSPEQPEELAKALKRLINMPEKERKQMGEKGRKFVEEHFNREKIAADFLQKLKNRLSGDKNGK